MTESQEPANYARNGSTPMSAEQERTWATVTHGVAGAAMILSAGTLGFVAALVDLPRLQGQGTVRSAACRRRRQHPAERAAVGHRRLHPCDRPHWVCNPGRRPHRRYRPARHRRHQGVQRRGALVTADHPLRPVRRLGYSSRLLRTAYIAASMRDFIWSFSSRFRMWFLTVFSLMKRSSAISRLLWPLATCRST